jgi:hypothetical protein
MDGVVLVLPQNDYAAMLSAAMRGTGWRTGSRTTRPLMNGIDAFDLSPAFNASAGGTAVSPTTQAFTLATYRGWGVAATNLTLTSETPLPADYALPDLAPSPEQENPEGEAGEGLLEEDQQPIAIGVGVGGGVMLILALVSGYLLVRRRKYVEQQCVSNVQ